MKNDIISQIVDHIEVSRVQLWIGHCYRKWLLTDLYEIYRDQKFTNLKYFLVRVNALFALSKPKFNNPLCCIPNCQRSTIVSDQNCKRSPTFITPQRMVKVVDKNKFKLQKSKQFLLQNDFGFVRSLHM